MEECATGVPLRSPDASSEELAWKSVPQPVVGAARVDTANNETQIPRHVALLECRVYHDNVMCGWHLDSIVLASHKTLKAPAPQDECEMTKSADEPCESYYTPRSMTKVSGRKTSRDVLNFDLPRAVWSGMRAA